MVAAWVIRSGRYGERDDWSISTGHSGAGWREVADLTDASSRESVLEAVRTAYPDATPATLATQTGQVWALRGRIQIDDLLVMPMKTTKKIAIGKVIAPYHYLEEESEPDKRHVVDVEWLRTDLPRSAVKQDLLYTLGSALSIFAPTKNNAVGRLQSLLATGTDPGALLKTGPVQQLVDETVVEDPDSDVNTEEVARDRITTRVNEEFKGHGLATLVAEVLTAQGFTCTVSPAGPDQGIDIVAGRGPFGIDAPRVVVQVKSGGAVGNAVVNELNGVVNQHGADQGLLVAWDGLTSSGRSALRNIRLRIALWESADVVDQLLNVYDRLSDDTRARLPLKRVWMLVD